MFNPSTGSTALVEGEDLIDQKIRMVLEISKGSTLFMPGFGSSIQINLFEPNDMIFEDLVKIAISEVLSEFLPDIQVLDIITSRDSTNENRLRILLTYALKNSNIQRSVHLDLDLSDSQMGR